MASELGGNMEGLIINCLQAAEQEYDPEYHTDAKMAEDVNALYEMGQGYVSAAAFRVILRCVGARKRKFSNS